jgi:copper homeostasis protein
VRPRGGDFIHSDIEFDLIKKDIQYCKKIGMDGIVVGIQRPDMTLDIERMKRLHDLARPMKQVVCHRAFDRTPDAFEEMEKLIAIGYDRILTSGQQDKAIQGKELLRGLIAQANDRISIMPGSGIVPENVLEILTFTGAKTVHMTLKEYFKEKDCWETNLEDVKKVVSLLDLN